MSDKSELIARAEARAEWPKPRTVGFLDVPIQAATPPTLEAALTVPEVEALVEALREIRDMPPHYAGQTRNECLMQQIACQSLRKVEGE